MSPKELQTSPENLQQRAVNINLPADLLTQLEQVKAQADALSGGNENWLKDQIQNLKSNGLYGHDMSEFIGDLDVLEKSGLEPFNFRVDSTGWEMLTEGEKQYLISPDKNIKEIVSGRDESLIGEQLFNWEGAQKYISQFGKSIPSEGEWENIVKNISSQPGELEKILGKLCIGISYFSSSTHINSHSLRNTGNGWSSSRQQACLYIGIPGQKIVQSPIILSFNNTFNFIRCFKK